MNKQLLKISLLSILMELAFIVAAQMEPSYLSDTLVDVRDNKVYEIVRINKLWWFKDNLNYETKLSHCPNYNKKDSDCEQGNFYAYQELDTICPKGWRVAETTDWEKYLKVIRESKNIEIENIGIDTFPGEYLSINFTDLTDQLHLFEKNNPLGLASYGWVEGRKRNNKNTATLWAKHPGYNDNRFHLHIGDKNYILHTHAHNIDDKSRKVRKFMVKCVCEDEAFR
jgi:uncharacterized protein (TIGR02145 family)